MKTITLINPEEAQELFHRNRGWNNTLDSYIKALSEENTTTLVNANECNAVCSATTLKVKLGSEYTIPLDEFADAIQLEFKEITHLGALLSINEEPWLLRVYNSGTAEAISQIGQCFPSLRIIDFGSAKNPNIETLDGFLPCRYLHTLNLDHCYSLRDIRCLPQFMHLETLCLDGFTDAQQFWVLSACTNLKKLSQYGSDLKNLTHLEELKSLELLLLLKNENLSDISSLSELTSLNSLYLWGCKNLIDLSPLKGLHELTDLDLGWSENLTDLSPIASLHSLINLNLGNCENLTDLSLITGLHALKNLNLNNCSKLTDFSPLMGLHALTDLNLGNCENIKDLSPLKELHALQNLKLSGCTNLTRIQKICKLPRLQKIDSSNSPNIRDFEKLASLPELQELKWIDPLACSEVLMQCALNRQDKSYILEHSSQWIKEISRCKDAVRFCSLVLRCVGLLPTEERSESLSDVCTAMRERGLQAERTNDLDAFTWETWCTSVLELGTEDIERSFNLAAANLDSARETEVVLGPLIVASASWIELHPSEKQHVLSWVHKQLQLLEEYPEAQRQIAPSAAVFFASLNDKEQVNFWLAKATDERAPLWREKVLLALVAFYAKKQVFSEARRLISEMSIEDQKDKAIVETASAMAQLHPVDAAFLLDDVKDLNLSSAAARQLLEIPEVLSQPQGIYQLLLHLQGDPEELASCLEALIHKDPEGKVADAVSSLFVHQASSGPSASVLLELCKHPAIAEFIPKRALDNYISGLQESAQIELASSVSHLVDDLQKHDVLKAEYAAELTAMMQG
jgi:hypothetical protein